MLELPVDAVAALMLLIGAVVIPLLVYGLGRAQLSGDRKRAVVIVVSVLLGVLYAILSGALAVPESVLSVITQIVVWAGIVFTYSQAVFQMIRGKLDGGGAETDPPGMIIELPERAE